MRSDVLNSNSSSFSLEASKGLVKIESKIVEFTGSSANIDSGAMSIPANSIITRLTAVVHSALTVASGTVGVSVGTAAGGTQFTGTLDADCLEGSGTSVAAGIGSSTDDVLTAALGGTAILGTLAAAYRAAATDVHFRTVGAGGAFTAGKMCYIIEYIELKNN
tara:strand:- start:1519 stop:2007 length:489 start_codon:yes stop_codon:yes gene_type:complete